MPFFVGLGISDIKIREDHSRAMVGPRDGGFGFDQSKKYTKIDNIDMICVQCQAGQHKNCLVKAKKASDCECEHCIIFG